MEIGIESGQSSYDCRGKNGLFFSKNFFGRASAKFFPFECAESRSPLQSSYWMKRERIVLNFESNNLTPRRSLTRPF
ncbi:hypothetical protein CH380_02515 [Leptospira adleri]|uniref:Uncharacterized protein n=1 Tax=Leptospira adleri TaxID=2023186 RepID=A0A2M9YSV5_9LEPT|nr:hypothetical protein CH380_02515 [Leptospira adleri]PJZ59667.1 hypothetical protein CH376_22510 [Leptospira adleri]